MVLKEKGWSAIFFAVEKGDVQISKLLLQSGAKLDLVGKVHINCVIYHRRKNRVGTGARAPPQLFRMSCDFA